LGHHLSGPGGLGPGGTIGPPSHTGLLNYNCVRLALNLFCSRPVHGSYGVRDVVAPSLGIGMVGVFARFQAEYVSSRIVDEIKGAYMGEHYNMSGVCVMDMGYLGAAVYCDFTRRIMSGEYPDCVILGGMKAFRAVKYAFERYWLDKWF
jgi:hypothetical protein